MESVRVRMKPFSQGPSRRRRWLGLELGLLLVCSPGGWADSIAEPPIEAPAQRVRAAFLYNFCKLTDWPESAFADAQAAIVIGVAADSDFDLVLKAVIDGRKIGGRPVRVQRVIQPADLIACHVLYIGAAARERWPQWQPLIEKHPVLTVGEGFGFLDQGGALAFVTGRRGLRFAVNAEAVRSAGLRLSSRLLQLQLTWQPSLPLAVPRR